MEPRLHSRYADWAAFWALRPFIPGWHKKFLSSLGIDCSFSGRSVKLAAGASLVSRLETSADAALRSIRAVTACKGGLCFYCSIADPIMRQQ
jgi:hypothetical protein